MSSAKRLGVLTAAIVLGLVGVFAALQHSEPGLDALAAKEGDAPSSHAGSHGGSAPVTETSSLARSVAPSRKDRRSFGSAAAHTLRGRIETSDGIEPTELKLRVRIGFGEYRYVRVESDYTFQITGLAPGKHTLRAMADGYFRYRDFVELDGAAGLHETTIALQAIPYVQVTLDWPEGESPKKWFAGDGAKHPFEVVATREPLPSSLRSSRTLKSSVGRIDWETQREGTLALTEDTEVYVNLILDKGVVDSRFLPRGIHEVVFHLDRELVRASCGEVVARFVHATSGRPLEGNMRLGRSTHVKLEKGVGRIAHVPAGKRTFSMHSKGMERWSTHAVVQPRMPLDLGTIVIEAAPRIRGRVTGPMVSYGRAQVVPVAGHARDVRWSRKTPQTPVDSETSSFEFENYPPGRYLVRVRCDSGEVASEVALVDTRPGQDVQLDVKLQRLVRVGIPGRDAERARRYVVLQPNGLPFANGALKREDMVLWLLPGLNEIQLTTGRGTEVGRIEVDVEAPIKLDTSDFGMEADTE
ncbi:MAG: hypothetical protein GY711_13190 [bacterium]|nr:hypothetical protein [bacterium]